MLHDSFVMMERNNVNYRSLMFNPDSENCPMCQSDDCDPSGSDEAERVRDRGGVLMVCGSCGMEYERD
jgi:hypothetical protein